MKYYQGMGIFTPGEQRNTEYLKLKYSPSTPDPRVLDRLQNGWILARIDVREHAKQVQANTQSSLLNKNLLFAQRNLFSGGK